MKMLFGLIAVVLCSSIIAQNDPTVLKGLLLDGTNMEPVANAHVSYLENGQKHTISDDQGRFILPLDQFKEVKLNISHISFQDTTVLLTATQLSLGSTVEILLMPNSFNIPEAIISSAPKEVFGSSTHHVADFAFLNNGILLLTYEKEERWKRPEQIKQSIYQGCKLVWIDSLENEKCELRLTEKCHAFYEDFLNECFLETEKGIHHIGFNNDQIILRSVDTPTFEEQVLPVVDTINDYTVASNYYEEYPAFEYYGFNHQDSSVLHFCQVIDEPLMEQYRSEFKWLSPREKLEAYRLSLKHEVDKEVVGAMLSGFSKSMYYQELYAPLFLDHDTVEVFDHYKHQIFKFDENLNCIDSVPITYHLQKHWAKTLVQDEERETVYALFEKYGKCELRAIEKSTGAVQNSYQLTYKHPEQIKVKNGSVYYIYRPFESSQKRFLYKEELANVAP